ncbi:hypothetical protein EC968_000603 [Mortierella alpina]|nr:hypothetical protein EC968_000603 [Mortierella alpina]
MRSFHNIVVVAVLAALAVVNAQGQKEVVTDRTVPISHKFSELAEGPYPSASSLEKRAGLCTDISYPISCTGGCCRYSCSKYGSGCGCDLTEKECSDGGCCPLLSTCSPNNKCTTITYGGSGGSGGNSKNSAIKHRSSGAVAALMAMGAVFANA